MDERRIRIRRRMHAISAVCLELAWASCAGDGHLAMESGPGPRIDAGAPEMPGPTADASMDGRDAQVDPSRANADAATPAVSLPSMPWVHAPGSGAPRERWTPPPDATDTGPTKTLSSNSTVIAIDIAQPDDPGDPSYTWYEEVDGDPDDEVCTSIDDEETGHRYVFCEGVSAACDDGFEFEGVLLMEFMPDDTYTVVLFGAELCGSSDDAPACSYDAAGNELSCGIWFGAAVESVAAG